MSKKQKIMLWRILISIAMLIALGFSTVQGYLKFALYMVVYLIIGYDILLKALKGIKNRQMFDESFLMTIATVGAIALGLYKSGIKKIDGRSITNSIPSYTPSSKTACEPVTIAITRSSYRNRKFSP